MSDELGDIYRKGHFEDTFQRLIEGLIRTDRWSYQDFKKILIALSIIGPGHFVPAHLRPESIIFDGLRLFIDELVTETANDPGSESARMIFADIDRRTLMLGKKTHGRIDQGQLMRLDKTPQPSRASFQRRAASIHTHPEIPQSVDIKHGLSDIDYLTFLADTEQIAMFMAWGGNVLIALKTSGTPNNLSTKSLRRRISSVKEDYLDVPGKLPFVRITDFNKAVCTELGLTLYKTEKPGLSVASRVPVTNYNI